MIIKNNDDKELFYTAADLKKRGWTETYLRHTLPNPDKLQTNPFYKNSAPMRLYLKEKVHAVEQTLQFRNFIQKSAKRKEGARKATITKKQKLLGFVNALVIELEQKDIQSIYQDAIDRYNDWNLYREEKETASMLSSKIFLDRIAVNYLRHQLSNYDEMLYEIFGKVGVAEAYAVINRKIYTKIAATYPELKEEAERQEAAKEKRDN